MMNPPPYTHPFRVADLAARKGTTFELLPTVAQLATIAAEIGISAIRKLRFTGELTPPGNRDWVLTAALGATVVQPCVVTLAPVSTRIDEPVKRTYLAHMPAQTETEVELQDETIEPLGPEIDVGAVLLEALTLALPLYPRANGVEFGAASYTQDGPQPLDDKIRPFAGLRDKLGGGTESG